MGGPEPSRVSLNVKLKAPNLDIPSFRSRYPLLHSTAKGE